MPQVAQLNFYLDLRRRLLAHEFSADERLVTKTFTDATGLTHSATIGVLNALSTDGYLNKHKRSYTAAMWSADSLFECTDRLEVFVEICAARVIVEQGPRLKTLHRLAGVMANTDPEDEAFFLRCLEWLAALFEAGERRTISEVAHKLIPQAYYRVLWLLLTSSSSLRNVVRKVAAHNLKAMKGDLAGVRERQVTIFANVRRALELGISSNPSLRFDRKQLDGRVEIREADVRGRILAMSHPVYPLFLPADRSPSSALPVRL
jgi:DNA-binding GntR family transcriptional regulator